MVSSIEFQSVVLTAFDQGASKSAFGWSNLRALRAEKSNPASLGKGDVQKNSNPLRDSRSAASSWCFFLEPFARSGPKKSNPASQGNDDVQEMRTLRVPDLSKVHLGAGGEKLKILASKFVLEIDFFDHGNFKIFRPARVPT